MFGSIKQRKHITLAVHVLFWLIWMLIPFILVDSSAHKSENAVNGVLFRMTIPMLFSLALFYINYFVVVDKLLYHKKIMLFFVGNILLIVVFNILTDLYFDLVKEFYPSIFPNPAGPKPPRGFFKMHNILNFFIVAVCVAIKATSGWYVSENERKNLENENLKSELSNLKMQLNPHFFFNTLNNIYALIEISPEKAQEAVHGLSKLMRYHLYDTNEELVPLDGEIDAMQSYIALMQLRLSKNAEIRVNMKVQHHNLKVAPLLFIPIIENAFKHGVNPAQKSVIEISLSENGGVICFETVNTNAPQVYADERGKKKGGIGLDNLKKRLDLIYQHGYDLSVGPEGGLFRVKLVVKV